MHNGTGVSYQLASTEFHSNAAFAYIRSWVVAREGGTTEKVADEDNKGIENTENEKEEGKWIKRK